MGLREQMTKRPRTVGSAVAVVVVMCVAFSVWQLQSGGKPPLPTFPDKMFFTIDDGATLFADSMFKFPPIDHEGKSAVRARVFTCDRGKHQWVQFLEKYDDADKRLLESPPPDSSSATRSPQPLVKRPGPGNWIPQRDPKAFEIMKPTCPDGMGGGPIEPVLP